MHLAKGEVNNMATAGRKKQAQDIEDFITRTTDEQMLELFARESRVRLDWNAIPKTNRPMSQSLDDVDPNCYWRGVTE